MSEHPPVLTPPPNGYTDWLAELKGRIHTAQLRAALAVNRELVSLYWQIGHDILERQSREGWGAKVIERLAHDLRTAFPDMKGFSPRNLKYMRSFAQAWPDAEFVQAVLAQLPWYHQIALLDKLPDSEARHWYAAKAMKHNWSRNILVMQIETRARERSGQAVTSVCRLHCPIWHASRSKTPTASTFSACTMTRRNAPWRAPWSRMKSSGPQRLD